MDMPTIKKQVENCLELYPATRDRVLYLVISTWKNHHRNDFINFLKVCIKSLGEDPPEWMYVDGDMRNLPEFETIRRSAQVIQNTEGKYLPSEEVSRGRVENEKNIKDWIING